MTTELPKAVDLDEFQRLPNGKGDPSLTAADHAHARARKLVEELQGGGLAELTRVRDTLDDLMHVMRAKAIEVEGGIADLANFVQKSVEMAAIIRGPIEEQARAVNLGTIPGKTVTSR